MVKVMRLLIVMASAVASTTVPAAVNYKDFSNFHPTDLSNLSPCPAINALANHGNHLNL